MVETQTSSAASLMSIYEGLFEGQSLCLVVQVHSAITIFRNKSNKIRLVKVT